MSDFMRWLRRGNKLPHPNSGLAPNQEIKSAINPLIAFHGFGDAAWCDASYQSLAREGYLKNPVVHRCIRMIAEAGASLPWLLYDKAEEMEAHPILRLLKKPNTRQAGQELMEAVYSSLLISGNAYLHQIEWENTPREIHLLRSDRIEPIEDEFGWPSAYAYSVNGSKTRYDIAPERSPILHIALFNPLSDFEGSSPLGSAHMALDIHNAASRWNKALLDNSARPSGALVYANADSGNLTEEQFDRLKHELEEGYSGASKAGRPMLLEGGLDWKQIGLTPKDMDFMEARNGAARDIALAFGVPPMLLGIPGDNTYANYQEANRAFWRQTVLPMVTRVSSSLSNWLNDFWTPELKLDVDRDQIEALAADREALWKRVNEATFLTVNEKRAATGYGEVSNVQEL